ncbi:5'-3' exonuclease H3TH domain-containing protein [Virgibacillus soli]|uniref:5'-3' exonuclease n=1 Tax=Paracerasibacillus soli TaxID=480284 RepID=UPI0035EAEAFB
MKQKILLVDGMALLFRGFYATSYRGNYMKTSNGTPTNAVQQFLHYFLHAIETYTPTHVICCWDMGSKTFRTELYENYKSNRGEPPVELIPQFDLVKEVVSTFDVPNIGLQNYEADDCIGTLANQYATEHEVYILTGDHDILQLVKENIHVIIMRKGKGNYDLFTEENFFEKMGVYPKQIVDMKGLMGDTADNYPGVKGIGEKSALKLLTEYETIDQLLEKINELPKGMQTRIKTNMDMLHLSRNLAEIKCDVPISCKLEEAEWDYNKEKVSMKFTELEFSRLAKLI